MIFPGPATRSPADCTLCSATWCPAGSRTRSPLATQRGSSARSGRAPTPPGLLDDIRHLDAQRREIKKKLAAAVKTAGTSLTEIFGVGPIVAATVIGDVVTVARFPTRDHFAACNGTAPVEVSSGQRKNCRLSLRGNRRLNHAIHMAAITQISHAHSDGRACYQRKIAEGKTHKEALRCLKRRISDAIYARLRADARMGGPGGQPGNRSASRATGSHPEHRLFGQATPGPEASLRAGSHPGRAATRASVTKASESHLTTGETKRIRSGRRCAAWMTRTHGSELAFAGPRGSGSRVAAVRSGCVPAVRRAPTPGLACL